MDNVRIAVIGLGNMGKGHASCLVSGEVPGAQLTAVCDISPQRLEWAKERLGETVRTFADCGECLSSPVADAVLIATPHVFHPDLAVRAFAAGKHVLVEKPAGVSVKQVRRMNEAAAESGNVFAIMYNQRTDPLYQTLRELISSGEIGRIKRINWIVTDWYRPQRYYDSAEWRATWEHEGGGVLLNQCPHNLDLLQWTTGMMPSRIRAFCHFGKHRNVEVEDDVTAYMEFANGATGVFVTGVADAPGTNRYEVTGDRGKIVIEDGTLTFWRLRQPESQFNRECGEAFGKPECWKCDVPVEGEASQHRGILRNFADAVRKGVPLLAPGEEGINGLMLSNAMHLSSWTDAWVELPFDENLFDRELQARIRASKGRKGI